MSHPRYYDAEAESPGQINGSRFQAPADAVKIYLIFASNCLHVVTTLQILSSFFAFLNLKNKHNFFEK